MQLFFDGKEITNISEFEINHLDNRDVVTYTFKIDVEGNSELCKALYKMWRNQHDR